MIIYRLERNGIGPFIGGVKFFETKNPKKRKRTSHVQSQVKEIKFDFYFNEHCRALKDKNYVFGTKSKEFLKAYFRYNLKLYFKQGYKIKTYNVPDIDVIDLKAGGEVAFHVKHHKFKTVKKLRESVTNC